METNKIKISVIIPTYNRAKFIPNAVKSIIDQNYNNIEIIIVDDGSTDNTAEVVNALKKEHHNFIYCRNDRQKGPSGARNTGIIRSSGDFISFLDTDDIWLPGHLQGGMKILSDNSDIDVVFGNYKVVEFESGHHRYDFFDQKEILWTLNCHQISTGVKVITDNLFTALIRENFFSLVGAIIKKSVCSGILFHESVMFAEDRDFAIKLYKKADARFAFREEPVFIAYKHASNTYNTKEADNVERVTEAHIRLYKNYLMSLELASHERKMLRAVLAKKISTLAYINGRNKSMKNAFSLMAESFHYGCTFMQIQYAMKTAIVLILPVHRTDNIVTA